MAMKPEYAWEFPTTNVPLARHHSMPPMDSVHLPPRPRSASYMFPMSYAPLAPAPEMLLPSNGMELRMENVKNESFLDVEPIAFHEHRPASTSEALDLDPLSYSAITQPSAPLPHWSPYAYYSGPATMESPTDLAQSVPTLEPTYESTYKPMPMTTTPVHFQQKPKTISHKHSSPSRRVFVACKSDGCSRRVRSRGYCKAHGGGKKCIIDGCGKSSQNGDYCIGHGGGKKCKEPNCPKAAQSHGLCKAHGGGARCKFPNCNKSSQGGGLCRAHGGGKRCQAENCVKGAQRGDFCATHGGYRSCSVDGCVRTDRGGGFCEVHRRGKTCKVDGCKKLSRNNGMCTAHIREVKQYAYVDA